MWHMQYHKDHNIVVTVWTSSRGELIVRDGNSCMTYTNSNIFNENWVIERYQGYTKADLMTSCVTYEIVNILQMKSALDTRSIL